jgi:hypothetical protein
MRMSDERRESREAGSGRDAGAFIGHEPEPATDTILGGLRPDDERVSAGATQSTGVGGLDRRDDAPDMPEGHREGAPATDDEVRRAGESH